MRLLLIQNYLMPISLTLHFFISFHVYAYATLSINSPIKLTATFMFFHDIFHLQYHELQHMRKLNEQYYVWLTIQL